MKLGQSRGIRGDFRNSSQRLCSSGLPELHVSLCFSKRICDTSMGICFAAVRNCKMGKRTGCRVLVADVVIPLLLLA